MNPRKLTRGPALWIKRRAISLQITALMLCMCSGNLSNLTDKVSRRVPLLPLQGIFKCPSQLIQLLANAVWTSVQIWCEFQVPEVLHCSLSDDNDVRNRLLDWLLFRALLHPVPCPCRGPKESVMLPSPLGCVSEPVSHLLEKVKAERLSGDVERVPERCRLMGKGTR